ncbi:hypothetical protein HYPSUDRAFT_200352 [Hypholoma sublateritium FD-334 SS-4]|uniref:F-box domain-containing protein n=1 Tax=Hypholoma sublateritium (strain FD-334 SS-4) TaxID=945553 RepID=A0A0D2P1L4_HYPSF|nr:hypothetical protein HYPSUDRAFT_200352 [Hypholoma sublateritium FD-334 SS-4]
MFTDKHALRTTRITSQVCHSWRNLMLATPTLWARLIDVDRISHPWSDKWRDELMRRTGDAPLWIKANTFRPSMDMSEFLEIVRKNWHRIQQLVVRGRCPSVDTLRLPLDVPAPLLDTFIVSLSHAMLAEVIEDAPLFGGYAPMLRIFHFNNYVVGQGVPWLCRLNSLTLNGVYGICDIVAVLSEAHRLCDLQITNISFIIGESVSSLPVVSLTHLKSLGYIGDPLPCVTLLDHIRIPSGCSLSVHIPTISEGLDFTAAEAIITKFTCNARRFLQTNIFEVVQLTYLPDCMITFEGQTTFPVESTHNLTLPLYGSDAPEELAMFLRQISSLDLSKTTALQLFTDKETLHPSFGQIFGSLPSLDTICVESHSLQFLMKLQNDMDLTDQPDVIFPALRVITFILVISDHRGRHIADQIAVAVKFIISRVKNGHPIAQLDMGDTLPFDGRHHLEALSEVKDLELIYTCSPETKVSESSWNDYDEEECIDMF